MRIATFDGGGIRGLLTARILDRIDKESSGFLAKADLFAGTSTGGILALALASGLPASSCVDLYANKSKNIFQPRGLIDSLTPDEYIRSDYDPDGLKEALISVFGDKKLGDLKKDVLIPAFDMRRWQPKFFDRFHDADVKLVDVAMSTSAAPTFFPSHGWKTEDYPTCYVDGGLFANNPSDCAIAFAQANGIPTDKIRLLSVGTGLTPTNIPSDILSEDSRLDWGYRQWIVKNPHYLLMILFDGAATAAHYRAKQQLGDRYLRLQPNLGRQIEMDDTDAVQELIVEADRFDVDAALQWIGRVWNK